MWEVATSWVQNDSGLSEGNLGGLTGGLASLSFCSRYRVRGGDQFPCPRSIPPLLEEVAKRCFGTFLQTQRPDSGLSLRVTLIPMDLASKASVATTFAALVLQCGTAPLC